MSEFKTFDQLWEACELLHKDMIAQDTASALVDELVMKLGIYKAICDKPEIPPENAKEIKLRTIGEVLLTLTNLSLKDNINVFAALDTARQYRSVEHFSKKYKPEG